MKITVEAEPKEIADLVLAVQGRQITETYHNKTNIDEKSLDAIIGNSDCDDLIKKHCKLR